LAFVPALAFPEPIVVHQVACHSTTKAVLYNGTVLELPSLRQLAQLGPIEGCDIYSGYGESIAVWRGGQVEVYDGLSRRFAVRGERAYIGMRFVMVTARDFVAVYSLHGFEVLRLDRHTAPAAVWVLEARKAGSKAVILASPTTCRVRMQVESYLLVYDLDTGLYDVYRTGAAAFLAVPSGVVWAKNGTLYHNGRAIGKAPGEIHPVYGFDGYATVEGGVVLIVALNGSTWRLRAPAGRGLAVSALREGFAACSDHECACTLNCTGFSAIAYQAFAPPLGHRDGHAHYLLYANTVLYILEKPKPAPQPASTTAPQNATKPATTGTTPPENASAPASAGTTEGSASATTQQPSAEQPPSAEAQQPTAPAALNTTQHAPTKPAQFPNVSAAPRRSPSELGQPEQAGAEPVPAWLLAAAAAVAVLVIYLLYRRRHL
jgi:hypothetical protein